MKYSGGKKGCTRGVVRVVRQLLPAGGSYWEPFCGSCKVVQGVRCARRHASDADPHVVNLLKAVQAGWVPPGRLTEDEYARWRKLRHTSADPMVGFCGYGCSFGGKFFGGYARASKDNRFERGYAKEAKSSLLTQKPLLAGVDFRVRDYRDGPWFRFPGGLVVYCDPPYAGTITVGSTKEKFDSNEFWAWAEELSRSATVLVSELECPVAGAVVLWSREINNSLDGAVEKKKAKRRRTEKLFCLRPELKRKVGFGI